MFRYNYKYELKLLLRSQWIQLLSVVLLTLFGFSALNGKQKIEERKSILAAARQEVRENDQVMLRLLDSTERGMKVSASPWMVPNNPMAVGNYYPRVAAMDPQPFAFVATGQGDLFTHYVKPTASGDDFALNFVEMTSPVQLLFGSFDLAFVIVYLLPLLIVAFSYNILSAERENGVLSLLAAQPIGISQWVLQKLGLRFLWLSILVASALVLVPFVLGLDIASDISAFLGLLGLVLGYMLFWFALAFLANLWGGNSAKNAVTLLGLWVLFVLLVPSVLNQLGSALYPMPPRTLMINEMRKIKADATAKQDEILDNFLRDHPEYAINDTTQSRTFWHSYMASQQLVKEELEPVVNAFETQLQKQQAWMDNFKWLSPAVLVQESLNRLAGTASGDYENFRKQVVAFAETWRGFLTPFLYNNQEFTQTDYAALPAFQYKSEPSRVSPTVLTLLAFSGFLFGLGIFGSATLKAKTRIG